MKYKVYLKPKYKYIEIEADNEQDAIEQTLDTMEREDGLPGLDLIAVDANDDSKAPFSIERELDYWMKNQNLELTMQADYDSLVEIAALSLSKNVEKNIKDWVRGIIDDSKN